MAWLKNVPADLHRQIDVVLSMRDSSSNEIRTEFREWLIKHNVEAPKPPGAGNRRRGVGP